MRILLLGLLLSVSAHATHFKLLTHNLWQIPIYRKYLKPRMLQFGKDIQNIDIVVMQEAFSRKGRRKIHKSKSHKYKYFRPSYSLRLNGGLHNLSKYKIVKKSFYKFKACGGAQCIAKKGVTHMRVSIAGKEIDIFNTHLQPFESEIYIRARQLRNIRKFIDETTNYGEIPAVFAGDFNIVGETEEYHELLVKTLHDFTDAWTHTNPHKPGFTWDSDKNILADNISDVQRDPLIGKRLKRKYKRKYGIDTDHINPSNGNSLNKRRLDYIFIRNGKKSTIKIHKTELFGTKVFYDKKGRPMQLADHLGVLASLEIN